MQEDSRPARVTVRYCLQIKKEKLKGEASHGVLPHKRKVLKQVPHKLINQYIKIVSDTSVFSQLQPK